MQEILGTRVLSHSNFILAISVDLLEDGDGERASFLHFGSLKVDGLAP